MIHRTVVAVFDAPQFAVALAGADVATHRALLADTGGELHVPLAVVARGVGLVGEHPGGTDLDQIAGEFIFQHAVLDAAEIEVVVRTVDAEVLALRIVAVIAHAAIAGDAAVHLVADERTEFLVAVGALGEAVAAAGMAGHHRHVLQVAVAAFLADRAIVGMVGHQPFDHAGAKLPGFVVSDGNVAVVGSRRHAGHHQPAAGVVGIGVLLDRALAAGADAAQRRMPAEIGNIKTERQAGLQQVVGAVDLIFLAVYMNRCHGVSSLLPGIGLPTDRHYLSSASG